MININGFVFEVKTIEGKGRSLITRSEIKKWTELFSDHVLIVKLTEDNKDIIDKTRIYDYSFYWGQDYAISLGLGCLINHSDDPNILHSKDYDNNMIHFTALRDIAEGEELTIRYAVN